MFHASRRILLKRIALLATATLAASARAADAGRDALLDLRVAIAGPHSLPFLPIELIPLLGQDRALGARLSIRYFPSGVRALEDVAAGNAHFAGVGFTVVPAFAAAGKPVVALAPLGGELPPFALLVRADLKNRIRKMADLRGHVIGISAGSPSSKTYLQVLAEMLLAGYGVKTDEVRWVATAQNLDGQYGALASRAVDALFCEETFSSNLLRRGLAYRLVDFHDPAVRARVPHERHLRWVLAAGRELPRQDPRRAEIMVRLLQHALAWIRQSDPKTVAARLGIENPDERRDIETTLTRHPDLYSADGRFSRGQIDETRAFMQAANLALPAGGLDDLIIDRWAGSKP
ncbi:MAG: ABC transporter substrate-binding protein [Sulfurisoma sp.]|nr:ABC transporter substrate-binding protein [Sulfurisoma sp.]